MNTSAISIRHIKKQFAKEKTFALNDINIDIYENQITGLVGPDGAGKTTLIRIISGLLKQTSGEIKIFGISNVAGIESQIGYMPQKFGLYEDLTVNENMQFFSKLNGVSSDQRKAEFDKMLHFTRLYPFTNRLVKFLSGGMKQKLGLACALMGRPQILLLDEPTVGVDPISRRELWQMCVDLKSTHVTILWSTSYLDEAALCDRVILLHEGTTQYVGPPLEFSKTVEGRVFKFSPDPSKIKKELSNTLNLHNVTDAVIQGHDIRVVFQSSKISNFEHKLTPITPRFEDAFINQLKGNFTRTSVLTENLNPKDSAIHAPIEAIGLTKKFGDFTAAKDISFKIKQGEIFGLLGPNGAGKSTTFKMLCGLLNPTEGQALVSGISLSTASSLARSKIGYMAQKFSLYGDLSVKENLSFFAGIYGLVGEERTQAINRMLDIFDLRSFEQKNSNLLSLGYKQRLALSCALMHNPDVLFLDEPTSGVDPLTRREFWVHINSLAQLGITVMITTHFMDEAEYCDRIALIYRGQCIASDTPNGLKEAVKSTALPNPSLEDAFITLIQKSTHREQKNA